jgi:hypothetical protein
MVFSVVDENLASNRVFLEKVLRDNGDILKFLSHQTQIMYQDLVLTALPNIGHGSSCTIMGAYYAAEAIYPPFWEDFEFAMAWLKAGHGFPSRAPTNVLQAWANERALCLAAAIYSGTLKYAIRFTGYVQFMVEVLKHRPEMYWEAKDAAANDPICTTIVFAASLELTTRKMRDLHFDGKNDEINRYSSFLRHKLDPYEVLFECILGNMLSTQSIDVTGTNLTLLNQGIETSINYKLRSVEYLDIPNGPWLLQLLQAERNVIKAIAPFETI